MLANASLPRRINATNPSKEAIMSSKFLLITFGDAKALTRGIVGADFELDYQPQP